jgi:hypothetical protein
MPHVLPVNERVTYWGIIRYEEHWWYFIFVILMWFIIGTWRDRQKQHGIGVPSRWATAIKVILILYGLFISCTGFTVSEASGYALWF